MQHNHKSLRTPMAASFAAVILAIGLPALSQAKNSTVSDVRAQLADTTGAWRIDAIAQDERGARDPRAGRRREAAARAEATGHGTYAIAGHSLPRETQSPELPTEIKTVTVGEVTAHFGGVIPPDAPLRFGIQALWFSFKGDNAIYPFKPGERLSFWEWNLDIFSPDGKHVLLLQARYGPYHLVRTHRLKDYLSGRAEPDEVVGKMPKAGEIAAVHEDARWLSATELRYVVACCGQRIIKTHRLRSAARSNSGDPLITYRPGLRDALLALSLRTNKPVDLVRVYYEYSHRARRNPGYWEKGKIQQGANPREYVPSDDELILAELGGRLVQAVEKKGWGQMAGELSAAGISLSEIRFKEFTFRHVDVMGVGRFHYVLPPRSVCARRDGPPMRCE